MSDINHLNIQKNNNKLFCNIELELSKLGESIKINKPKNVSHLIIKNYRH